MAWFIQLLIGIGFEILGYLMAPKAKDATKPPSLDDIKGPTAEHGRPIPVVFGTKRLKSPNAVWTGDKSIRKREIPLQK